MKTFLALLIVSLTAGAAIAQTAAVPPAAMVAAETISVSGTGRSRVAPDRFTFQVGVQTVSKTVEEAVNENNRRVAAVVAALKAAGAQDADIQTSNFNISPQQNYREGQLPQILGYHVANHVNVRSTKIADAGRLLGIAINAGVNTSSGINFEVSDPARGRDQGLRSAYDDARAKATLLAQAAGRTLGRAVYISEGIAHAQPPYPMPRPMAMEARASAMVGDVPVESGTQEQMYTVSVTFELR